MGCFNDMLAWWTYLEHGRWPVHDEPWDYGFPVPAHWFEPSEDGGEA